MSEISVELVPEFKGEMAVSLAMNGSAGRLHVGYD